ncbi:MAG: HEAT repeat domain-containing protein [Nitrospira sp.]|nr:HEAT repeat domain-containing protein [Nitrospira sp.]MCP9463441.1 HEAT repeat domain-containing protein [Nitrospira sp.]
MERSDGVTFDCRKGRAVIVAGVFLMGPHVVVGWSGDGFQEWLAQMPYEAPPPGQDAPDMSIPPNTAPLGPEELKRAEALLPLLEGKQEFWAMGEFVHLGEPAIPILIKALSMPSPRIRYNAIETISMIKGVSGVPALIETAKRPDEIPRVRAHALKVAIRLDPMQTVEALEVMAKDPNPSVRKAAAFEARYVRHKTVVPLLIELVPDDERFVAISAVQSLWILTRHETEFHDWDTSSKQDRLAWAGEWIEWWEANKETFEFPEPQRPKRRL